METRRLDLLIHNGFLICECVGGSLGQCHLKKVRVTGTQLAGELVFSETGSILIPTAYLFIDWLGGKQTYSDHA